MNCVPASCVPTERPVSTEWKSSKLSGGNSSAERRSKPTRAKYGHCFLLIFNFFISWLLLHVCELTQTVSKQNISHALRLRLVLFDESNRKLRKRLSSLPPPLLSLIFFSVDQRENSRVNWVIKYRNLSSRLSCWDTEDEFLWDEWNVLPFRDHFKQFMVKELD